MSYYVAGSGVSYQKFLQAKSFVDDVRWELSANRLATVATQKELEGISIKVSATNTALENVDTKLESINDTLREGFVTLHLSLQGLQQSVHRLTAAFDWHMTELATTVGRVGDSLEVLISLAKTPEQTWSFEQYDMARIALRRGLVPEAIQFIDRAIDGNDQHTGNAIEHRFHHLRATIFLGGNANSDGELVDLPKAEEAFVRAARCARVEYPNDAAIAMCGAAYAAYCEGDNDRAIRHAKQALSMSVESSEVLFFISKISFHVGDLQQGLAFLRKSILLDERYAIKCLADEDFLRHEVEATHLIDTLKSELLADSSVDAYCASLKRLFFLLRDGPSGLRVWSYHLPYIVAWLDQAMIYRNSNTFLGAVRAAALAKVTSDVLHDSSSLLTYMVGSARSLTLRDPNEGTFFRPMLGAQKKQELAHGKEVLRLVTEISGARFSPRNLPRTAEINAGDLWSKVRSWSTRDELLT